MIVCLIANRDNDEKHVRFYDEEEFNRHGLGARALDPRDRPDYPVGLTTFTHPINCDPKVTVDRSSEHGIYVCRFPGDHARLWVGVEDPKADSHYYGMGAKASYDFHVGPGPGTARQRGRMIKNQMVATTDLATLASDPRGCWEQLRRIKPADFRARG